MLVQFTDRSRGRWLSALVLAGIVGALPAAGLSFLSYKERDLVFRVEPGTAHWYSGVPAGVRDIEIPVSGNHALHAWWWPAAARNAPTVLYLHGSRWNLTGQLYRIEQLREFGFSVLAIDYRGFGKSQGGPPSEASVYEDARAAWAKLVHLQPDAAKRYIYGHSLGGAVAIELARTLTERTGNGRKPAAGLIVESSFTSLAEVAAAITKFQAPFQWLISQKFDSIEKIARISIPVLLVHGTNDRYIPHHFSEQLYEAAVAPKKLLLVEGGSHNNAMRAGSEEVREALRDLFGLGRKPRRAGH